MFNFRSGLFNNQHNAALLNVASLVNKGDPANPLTTILFSWVHEEVKMEKTDDNTYVV